MDSRKIIYLILLAMATGLVVVHLQTIHVQSINRMISMQSEEQELVKELSQQQVQLNSGIHSPEKILEKIKALNLDVKPLLEVELEARLKAEQEAKDKDKNKNKSDSGEQGGSEEVSTSEQPEVVHQWGDSEFVPDDEQQYDEDLSEELQYRPEEDTEDDSGATSESTEFGEDQDLYPDVPEEEKGSGSDSELDAELRELDNMGHG